MQQTKPSKPWRVTQKTSRGVLPATSFRSRKAAYGAVSMGRIRAERGLTDDVAAIVDTWDGGWTLCEVVDYPQHPDRLARRYEEALEEYERLPDMPGAYEAMQSAWDAMVEGGHRHSTRPLPH